MPNSVLTSQTFVSTAAPGTPPLTVVSPTVVPNLNADTVDGVQAVALQLVAEKGAANGYASLDAGTKVPVAQITAVLASSDLTNDAALEKVANKGAASGYASLDGTTKVPVGQLTGVLASSDLTNDAALEKTANKDAANGYAGLSAGSKIAASQISAVIASSDLTNDAALEKTANKGAASGYASLDGSTQVVERLAYEGAASGVATLSAGTLVVQNPASASATPGNAVIPIADANGELAVGFVASRVARWVKITKTFTDFSAAALTSDTEVLSLPAQGVIEKVVIKHTTAFSGGTIASYTVGLGIAGNFTKYAAAFDVFQAAGDSVFGFNNLPGIETFGGATSIRAQATATGDNLDQAVAGSVDFYVLYSTLP